MQVVSGAAGRERVHDEALPVERLPEEMRRFLEWFNAEPKIDSVLKAAVAHFWFVTLHPFEDVNGRIARATADLALARADASPQRFYSLPAQIERERRAYYDILEASQRGTLDITAWLLWFLACLDGAFDGGVRRGVRRGGCDPRGGDAQGAVLDPARGPGLQSAAAGHAESAARRVRGHAHHLEMGGARQDLAGHGAQGHRGSGATRPPGPRDRRRAKHELCLPQLRCDALRQLARDLRARTPVFVRGRERLTPRALDARLDATIEVARALEGLADAAETRPVTHAELRGQLEVLLGRGAWPRAALVSAAVVRAAADPVEANAVPTLSSRPARSSLGHEAAPPVSRRGGLPGYSAERLRAQMRVEPASPSTREA